MRRREFLIAASTTGATLASPMQAAYKLSDTENGKSLVAPNGRQVFEYLTKKPPLSTFLANSACCFHPVNTPSGERVTDLAPKDHPHHRGVFLAWHTMEFRQDADFSKFGPMRPTHGFNLNRGDFWGWGQFAPTTGRVIKNREVKLANGSGRSADVEIRNDWEIDGKKYMDEATTVAVREHSGAYVLDLSYKFLPDWDLVLPQAAFGGFCVRARADGESFFADPKGKIALPDPHYSAPDLNWPAAPWYAYSITTSAGKTVGCAVLDHPSNPPSTWHNPRYVWMINPCIVAGKALTAPHGKPFTLRYRVVAFDGAPAPAMLNELSAEWRKS
jgi:hypothetical protein